MAHIVDVLREVFTDGGQYALDEKEFESLGGILREGRVNLRVIPLPQIESLDPAFENVPKQQAHLYTQITAWLDSANIRWSTDTTPVKKHIDWADIVSGDGSLVIRCGHIMPGKIAQALKDGYGVALASAQRPGEAFLFTLATMEKRTDEESAPAPNRLSEFIRILALSGIVEIVLQQLVGVAGLGLIPLALLLVWTFLNQARSSGLIELLGQAGVAAAIIMALVNPTAYYRNSILLGAVAVIYLVNLVINYHRISPRVRDQGLRYVVSKLPRDFRLQMLWYLVFAGLVAVGALVFLVLGLTQ